MTAPDREDVVIRARDDYRLGGTVFRPAAEADLGAAVVVASATAVSRHYYGKFAHYLAERGFTVLTFDYRGIGSSAPDDLKGFAAGMQHWGEEDLAGAIDWLRETAQPDHLFMVGHSVGGQIVSLADNNRTLDGLVLVAAQSGYWRLFGKRRPRLFITWHLLIPLLTRIYGRLPKWLMGGEDLPAGVARQWARWGRHPDYIVSHGPRVRQGFARIAVPLLAYRFSDDQTAPGRAVAALLRWYENAAVQERAVDPSDLGVPQIGHFGFFRQKFSETLWREAGDWLVGLVEPNASTAPRTTVTVC